MIRLLLLRIRDQPDILMLSPSFPQSDFYVALQPNNQGKAMPGLFNTPDEAFHRLMKKPIASIYSMSNLVTFEPYADSTLNVFFEQLDRRYAQTDRECDLGMWLQWFAFDFMGEITFSHRLGFLERASDVDGIIGDIRDHFEASAPVSTAASSMSNEQPFARAKAGSLLTHTNPRSAKCLGPTTSGTKIPSSAPSARAPPRPSSPSPAPAPKSA